MGKFFFGNVPAHIFEDESPGENSKIRASSNLFVSFSVSYFRFDFSALTMKDELKKQDGIYAKGNGNKLQLQPKTSIAKRFFIVNFSLLLVKLHFNIC